MIIAKFSCHFSIDELFIEAFPDIKIFHVAHTKSAFGDIKPTHKNFELIIIDDIHDHKAISDKVVSLLGTATPDVFIVDDMNTAAWASHSIKPKKLVWYCHGRYTREVGRTNLKRLVGTCPTIYPSEDKKLASLCWKNPSKNIVQPLAVHSRYFVNKNNASTNGRCAVTRNNIIPKLDLYNPEETKDFFWVVYNSLRSLLDVYGFNPELGDDCGAKFIDIAELPNYSCLIEPFSNVSPSLSMLESAATGIPIVMKFPKEGFPDSGGSNGYYVVDSPEEMLEHVNYLLSDLNLARDMGLAAQAYIKDNFGSESWVANIRKFIHEIL